MKLIGCMETMDKISIVVAVYNAEEYLRKCIDSLLDQTYKNIEVILVNDCSTDASLEVCKEYSSKYSYIRTINNKINLGVSATRNKGIDASTGEYICFVDSDDFVEPVYLERLYLSLINYNSKLAICGCEYHNYIDNTSHKYLWKENKGPEVVSLARGFELSNALYLNALWNKLFVVSLIKRNNIKFDVDLSMGEDTKFALEYIKINGIVDVVALSEPLYHYNRWSDDSLMSRYYIQALGDYSSNTRLLYEIVKPLNNEADKLYENAINSLKYNLKYNIIRSNISFTEKKRVIRILYSNYSVIELMSDYILLFKEKTFQVFHR